MKQLALIVLLASGMSGCASAQKTLSTENIKVSKIWDAAPHNAFTDLILFNGAFYCAFREAIAHQATSDGKIRIIRSVDGDRWESVALLEKEAIDLRDPKLSITPDNRLMVNIGGTKVGRGNPRLVIELHPHLSFSDATGDTFSAPERATIDPSITANRQWLWRVTWHKGVGYGIDITTGVLNLMKTTDGRNYTKIVTLDIPDFPNESTIRFDEHDQMYLLTRREQGEQRGVLGKSVPPYTEWTYKPLTVRLGGPNFLFYKDGIIIGTRVFFPDGNRTGIHLADRDGNISRTILLPSRGDGSYPGMLMHNGELWFSYYSSHETRTSVFLAKIPLKKLQP